MTSHDPQDEALQRAFQSLGEEADRPCTPEDLELVWHAASGELPADERRDLFDRMADDAALAEAWRVATALQDEGGRTRTTRPAPAWWSRPWMAAAAALVLVATAVLLYQRGDVPPEEYRAPDATAVESLVPDDTPLPRDALLLRWTAGPDGSRYDVRVSTEDLDPVTAETDLAQPQLAVPVERLAGLPSGTRLLWQVDAVLPTGERRTSRTFTIRIE